MAQPAFHGNLPAQQFHQPPDKRQAHSGAFSEKALKRSKIALSRSASIPRPVSRTLNCTKSLISSAARRISPSSGVKRIAFESKLSRIDRRARRSAFTVIDRVGAYFHADVLFLRPRRMRGRAPRSMPSRGWHRSSFSSRLPVSSSATSIRSAHQVVELFGLVTGRSHQFRLQRQHFAAETLRQCVQPAP